jgi:hypothetical protein
MKVAIALLVCTLLVASEAIALVQVRPFVLARTKATCRKSSLPPSYCAEEPCFWCCALTLLFSCSPSFFFFFPFFFIMLLFFFVVPFFF